MPKMQVAAGVHFLNERAGALYFRGFFLMKSVCVCHSFTNNSIEQIYMHHPLMSTLLKHECVRYTFMSTSYERACTRCTYPGFSKAKDLF